MSMDSTRIFSSRSFDLTNSFNSDNELCAKFENVAITPEVMRAWRLRSYDASPANAIKDVLSLDADGVDLSELVTLTEQGKLTVFLDAFFAFDRLPQALERSMTARATGKIIVDL